MNLSLPASLSVSEREEQRKIQLFAPLSVSERGWGRGQIRLVELTLNLLFTVYYSYFDCGELITPRERVYSVFDTKMQAKLRLSAWTE